MNKSQKSRTISEREKPKKSKQKRGTFVVHVIVEPTNERFTVKEVYKHMTIAQLKDELELATGIPISLQRLSYLDEGELQDHTDVKSNDFIPGGTMQLRVWSMYRELLEAIAANDIEWVLRLGVSSTSDYHTPGSDYMTKTARKDWLEERAFVALCLAAHRGHEELVMKLIETGADINRPTATGKTALHLAAAVGNGNMINTLLQNGADINAEDENGNTALSVAERFGNKVCSRCLFQFQWQERAKSIKPSKNVPLFAHQYFDSNLPVWKRGKRAQIYVANILKPGEFEGTSLGAPKAGRHPSVARKELRDATFFRETSGSPPGLGTLAVDDDKRNLTSLRRPLTYQEWLQRRKESEKSAAISKKKQARKEMDENLEDEMEQRSSENFEYENWLEQMEKEGLEMNLIPSSSTKNLSRVPQSNSSLPCHQDGALRVYLRSLGKSRSGVSYEDWLNEKEMKINELVRQKSEHMSELS